MPAAAAKKIFISYARADGVELAQRLKTDLAGEGYEPWLDTDRISGGASWTAALESAVDQADVLLALLTHGSYVSEICRAEQLRALRKGKCVIPLLAQRAADIPVHLEAKNYRDFAAANVYSERFRTLLGDIQAGNGVVLKEEFRRTYVTAPPLPENFVARPDALAALRDAVIRERITSNLPLTALIGMGGIGKTRLAQALCRDQVVQQAFPDGVIWVTAGKEPAHDLVTRLREVGKALNDDLALYDNELGCRNQYKTTIRSKAALIVLDDVWSARDVEPFRAESPRSALLFTTRDASIATAVGALDHPAGSLTREESRAVLARWSATDTARLPPEAAELIAECGRLPLALAMVGATLRGKPPVLWKRQLGFLRSADLEKIKAQFPDYPYPNLFRAIQVSVDELDATTRERYLALAVLLDNMAAHPAIQQALWGTDEFEAAETAEKFIELSLAQRESDGLSIQLHGLQLDYVRSQYPDREALALIHGAVRLASHVIARDPAQFASQMAGRLLAHEDQPGIRTFTSRFSGPAARPWLRAITPSLTPPGGPLLLMIKGAEPGPTGDLNGLSALAVTTSQIVSATFDGSSLALWDLETGEQMRTLTGHSARIVALTVMPDGQQAISAAQDKTIRIWDLTRGETIPTIQCDATALAVMPAVGPGSHRFVAGSAEGALTVFQMETGEVVQTLAGCADRVNGVAVMEGRYVLACAAGKTFVWDLRGDPAPRVFPEFDGAMAVLPGTGRVASANEKTLKLWDPETGETAFTLTRESFGYDQVAALPDGRSLIYAGLMDVLEVVDAATGNVRLKLPNTAARVAFLAVTPDGRRAVTAVNSGEIRVWDLQGRLPGRVAERHSRWVRTVALTEGGQFAASISLDGSVMWNLGRGEAVYMFDAEWSVNPFQDTYLSKIPGPWNRHEALLPEGQAIAAIGGNQLQIRNFSTDEVQLPEFAAHDETIEIVRATPDGRRAVTGSAEGIGRIWDLPGRKEIASLQGHSGAIVDLVISQEARRIVSASMDHSLKVWDLDNGRLRRTLDGHTAAVAAVAWMPGRDYVVSASQDQTLRVWDVETGEAVAVFSAESALTCCAVAPDGLTIIAGEMSGGVQILCLEGAPEKPSQADASWSAEPNRPEMGAAALEMAAQLHSKAEYDQAEQLYQLALQIRIFLLGPADPRVAQSMNYLALMYSETKQYQKAEPLFLSGLAIYEQAYGPDHLNVGVNLYNLGLLYANHCEWTRAEPFYARSIAILEKEPGADPSILAAVLESLAEARAKAIRNG